METPNIQNLEKNHHVYSDDLKLQEATIIVSEAVSISRHKDEYQNYIACRLTDLKTNPKSFKNFLQWWKSADYSSYPNQ